MVDDYVHLCEPSSNRMFEFMDNWFGPVYYVLPYFSVTKKLDKVLHITKKSYIKFMEIHTQSCGYSILK